MILLLSSFFFNLILLPYIQKGSYIFTQYFLNSNCFQRDIGVNFVVELHFNLTITCLISVVQRELLIMMFLMHQALVMIESTHVVGFLNWKNGMSIITAVWMLYNTTDNNYSSLKQLSVMFVIKIVFLQQILFCIKNVYIYKCLLLFACPVCHFTYITHSCLQMHITESHGGPKTAISFL